MAPAGVVGDGAAPSIKVVHVAGLHRTGSTILANVLGELPGFFSAGELLYLSRTIALRDSCGCGAPLTECEVWKPILASAFLDEDDAILRLGIENAWLGTRNLPRLLLADRRADSEIARFRQALGALCTAIGSVTGARVVIETSKRPTFGWLLASAPRVDVYAVHLVRDPRATAASWRRAGLPNASPLAVGASWTGWHASIALEWRSRKDRYFLLRYEDFVRSPRQAILDVVGAIGENAGELPFVDEHTVRLRPNHTVQANENRFRTGIVPVRAGQSWRDDLSGLDAMAAMTLSWPLRRRWGYKLGG